MDGYPLYGDPFGINTPAGEQDDTEPSELKWGLLEPDDEDDDSSDEGEGVSDSEDDVADEKDTDSKMDDTGILTDPSSLGFRTPPIVNPRKDPTGLETPDAPGTLYQVLDPKTARKGLTQSFPSAHTYRLDGEKNSKKRPLPSASNKYQATVDPDELGSLDEETIRRKYQAAVNEEKRKKELKEQEERDARKKRRTNKSKFKL
eukprot:TRINITY_DN6865_c0_g1_i2.p1 TRINITY_DN6865_c0_g1~~TRINITY_DN6865_c0_g1_i2.p1  ORF type:complete len:203 (+),score=51.74 TRINITY_DN6865_c0_g1_i2:265-873(+)